MLKIFEKSLIFTVMLFGPSLVFGLPQPIVSLEFDFDSDTNKMVNLTEEGVSHIEYVEGLNGKALSLKKSRLPIKLNKFGLNGEGTISLWLMPKWDYYTNIEGKFILHSFLSMTWSDGSYFILADGWLEKTGGSLFTYFVYEKYMTM